MKDLRRTRAVPGARGNGRRWLALTAALTVAGVLASASAGASSESTATATSGQGTSGTSPVVAAAIRQIDNALAPLTFVPPGPQLNAKKLKGKRILVVVDDMSIPILAETADAAQSAGRLAGLQVTIVDGASDTSKIVQAVQEGIRTSNAELLIAIPAGLIPNELAQAKKAHIPIISCLDEQPVAGTTGQGAGPGYFGNISTNPILAGELIADSVIVATNGKAQVAIFSSTGADPSAYVDQGIRTEMGKCRALGCRVLTDVGTPGADWSSELAPRTAAVILRYPTLNYILPVFDGMTIFVAPAVQQSGVKTVHVVTFNASSAVLQDIQQGTIVTADPGQDNTWIGWASIDQAMRGILGLKPANPVQPVRYFDKSNLRGITVTNESKLFGSPAFRQGFMKLWGLG